jgi:MinD-like ATPase involved in chromosome partitioning or flagellar assembly
VSDVMSDPSVDLHAQINADGQVSVDDLPVPVDGGDPEDAVVATAAELAAQLGHPVLAAISDLRPGRYPQRLRISADGRREPVWPGGLGSGSGSGSGFGEASGLGADGDSVRTLDYGAREETLTMGHLDRLSSLDNLETLHMPGPDLKTQPATPAPAMPPHPHHSAGSAASSANAGPLPTVHDLLGGQVDPSGRIPAQSGWRKGVRRASGGLVALQPGRAERGLRSAHRTVQKGLDGPKTIVVVNPKGGAHKTTAALLLAATFGSCRGGYTLAWDNNESRGTLGWRARGAAHNRTAVDLLAEAERIGATPQAGVGDLDAFVRPQGDSQFDVLASDESVDSETLVDGRSFDELHSLLRRFYRILVVDTGNNMRADNWAAAVEAADALVVVSTLREDTAASAAWMIDALRNGGQAEKVARAVTILSDSGPSQDRALTDRLSTHFRRHTRSVVRVPYDQALVDGGRKSYADLSEETRQSWMLAAAAVAEGL